MSGGKTSKSRGKARQKAGRRRAEAEGRGASRLDASRLAPVLWAMAAAVSIWSFLFTVLLNTDLWFHLAAGRLIWTERAIPATDSWSFTAAGRPWQNHEWLSDVIFHLWSKAFGLETLVYWQWLVLGAAYLILFRVLVRFSGSYLWAYLMVLLGLDVGAPFFDIRPNLYSLLGFAILIHATVLRPRPSWALPVLFLVWMNLHGGAVFGLMALFITLAAWAIAGEREETAEELPWRRRALHAAGLWLACCGAALLNPYGWEAFAYPLRLAFAARSASRMIIYEWLPPFAPGGIHSPLYPMAIGVFVVAALALLATGGFRRQPRWALASLGLAVLTLAMSLLSRRFVPFFGIAQSLVAALALPSVAAFFRRGRQPRRIAAPAWSMVVALIALGIGIYRLAPYPLTSRAFDPLTWTSRLPVDALNYMEVNGLSGNIFAYFMWGGYVDYRTAGRLKVHIDPRSETVFDDETQLRHYDVVLQRPGWETVLESSGAQYLLWPIDFTRRRTMISQLESSGRWRRLYRDGVSVLLARSDAPLPAVLRPTPDSGYRSWALARQAMDRRDYEEAEALLERSLQQAPDLWPACQDLAGLHATRENVANTRAAIERCHRIFPDLDLSVEKLFAERGKRIPGA